MTQMIESATTKIYINWHEYPFVRLLIPLLVGILLAVYFPTHFHLFLLTAGIGLIGLVASAFIKAMRYKWLFGLFLSIILCSFSYLRTAQHHELNADDHFSQHLTTDQQTVVAWVAEMPEEKKWIQMKCMVESISDSTNRFQSAKGSLQIYLEKDSLSQKLVYGDVLQIDGRILALTAAKNPHAFDFARYLHFKNIHHQAFVRADAWKKLDLQSGNFLMRQVYVLRAKLLQILQTHLTDEETFAVGAALTLGYRGAISEATRDAYADTGAIHILAVSGLHVGIIYFIINWLLLLLPSNFYGVKLLKIVLVLAGIWLFALLTGASASVVRASLMFSVLSIGKYTKGLGNIYNTLAIAAFIALMLDPYRLFTVGFQLSYLAVIGIVFFQPKIYQLLYFKSKPLDYLWQITAVSLAAQIAVSPISIYYFHQFPLYFWLSSLIVIPAAFVVIVLAICLFLSSLFLPIVSQVGGEILHFVLKSMNEAILLIQHFPGGLIKGLWIELHEVYLLYAVIVLIGIFIVKKHKKWFHVALLGALFFFCSLSIRKTIHYFQKSIVIYHQPKASIIDFFDGWDLYALQSDQISAQQLDFSTQQHRWASGVHVVQQLTLAPQQFYRSERLFVQLPYLQFHDKRLVILDQQPPQIEGERLMVDYLLIRKNPRLQLEKVSAAIDAKYIIFDASNSIYRIQKWMKTCEDLGLNCYDVQASGAFVVRF